MPQATHAHADASADVENGHARAVPSSLAGFAAWCASRFGIGVLFALIAGYATREVYLSQQNLVQQMMTAFVERTKIDAKRAEVEAQMVEAMRGLTQEIRDAHQRAGIKP